MIKRSAIANFMASSCVMIYFIGITGCTFSTAHEPSLFERLGGLQTLTVVVSETIDDVSNDPKIKRSFKGVNLKTLKKNIVDHLCIITQGPCQYEGETMKNAHSQSDITEAEFELFVASFRSALNRHVDTREKNELLRILAPMKYDIVTK